MVTTITFQKRIITTILENMDRLINKIQHVRKVAVQYSDESGKCLLHNRHFSFCTDSMRHCHSVIVMKFHLTGLQCYRIEC